MKKCIFSLFAVLLIMLLAGLGTAMAADDEKIIILYENDVHCAVEGYAKLAAMQEELAQTNPHVGVVSCGDFIQGGSLGAISKGEYIVNIMNLVGYDAVAPGNHEFDYKIDRLLELTGMLEAPVTCSNFSSTADNHTIFEPYVMVSYGDTNVAYIGITTPDTLTSSTPSQFIGTNGEYIYTFNGDKLAAAVQSAINAAQNAGADYIIGLAHLGTEDVYEQWSTQTLVKNTSGFDVILDGHSHSAIENMQLKDKSGETVYVSSTGTKFANIGKLTLDGETITTELIPADEYTQTEAETAAYIAKINEEYQVLGERKIGHTEYDLVIYDKNGKRLVRNTETNLSDLCADAYRIVTGADIGLINGGGIRESIAAGDITFNDILAVFPFNNDTCIAEVTGQMVVDMLEMGTRLHPIEEGSFQHVSGLTFDLDNSIPSPVIVDENQNFVSVNGTRRVQNVKILNQETGLYEPIDLQKKYTLASHSYMLKEYGSGATMFKNATILSETGILDVELLEAYIADELNGTVSANYAASQNRINILADYIPLRQSFEAAGHKVVWSADTPQTVTVSAGSSTIVFTLNTNTFAVNGQSHNSDRLIYCQNGITYISADCLEYIQ